MTKPDLLQLEKFATLTPSEIEKQQPAFFSKLSERAVVHLKNRIEESLKDAPERIKVNLTKIDFTPQGLGVQDVKILLSSTLLGGGISAEIEKDIEAELAKVPSLGKLDDVLQPDLPLVANPAFSKDLMQAKMYRLFGITGLSQAISDTLFGKELNLNSLSNENIGKMVKDSTLTEKEARTLGFVSNLYALFDFSFELTEHIKNIESIQSMEDLIRLERADWINLVKDSKVELPSALRQEDYAEILYKKVEYLFPTKTLGYRFSKIQPNEVVKSLDMLQPLFGKNEKVFGTSGFDELKTDGLSPVELESLKVPYRDINRIAKVHPGLKINEILNDKELSAAEKGMKVVERISLLDKFIQNNPDVNYLAISYTHDSEQAKALNFEGFKPEEKTMVLNSVKPYQRIYSFTSDIEDAETILAAGYHSAYQITSGTLNDFVVATQLDNDTATRYFEKAQMAVVRSTSAMGSFLDLQSGSFDWLAVGNTSPSILEYLRDIPGYQQLFGEMAFCDCEHCQSIFSPAAYFVDLMLFVEKYVITKHFAGAKADHVLNLKVRRPDLWTLPLTCENTNTLIPYLVIINEILESFIARQRGFTGDLNDRNAVEDFVYKTEIALEKPGAWKDGVHAFTQPFHLPLESVSTYLGHFEKTREDIAILLNKPQEEVSKARLNLSEKEFQLITVADSSTAFIDRVFGLTFTLTAGKITPFDAQLLLKPMGVSRKELGAIVKTRFVGSNITIEGEKKDASSIQNDIERIKNLTYDTLDGIHRFVRLWRRTGWTIEETDLALTQLQSARIASGITPDTITAIGNLLRMQETLKVSVEELCALWSDIPNATIKENQKPLLQALFNHDDIPISDAYPKDRTLFIHPALKINKSTAPAEFVSARLVAGLNRSDAEVLLLIQNLAVPLGVIDINSDKEHERGFLLTLDNLSLLYRHSKIAELLKISIQELFQLLKLIPDTAVSKGYIENINHINEVLDFHKWWKSTSFSLDELHFIIEGGQIENDENKKKINEIAQKVINQTKDSNALLFADTLFAVRFKDINEEQSKAIIAANKEQIELSPDGKNYWLKPGFNHSHNISISIPDGIFPPEKDIKDLKNDIGVELIKYTPGYIIPFQLSGQVGLSDKVLSKLTPYLGATNLDDNVYNEELRQTALPHEITAITAFVKKILPLSTLFKDKKYDDKVIFYVISVYSLFGIKYFEEITIDSIQKLHSFLGYLNYNEDGSSNIDLLTDILNNYSPTTGFRLVDASKLAAVLKADAGLLSSLHSVIDISPNAINTLDSFKKYIDVCSYIGIGGDVLPKIVSNQYEDLNEATNAILSAFRSKYKKEAERKEKLEKYQDKLRGQKRSSLTTYLIHSGFPQFENDNDLFHYFLIDTELEGCARTSRLVAATMSLQLYLHRILLNLEQDNLDPGTPGRVNLNINPANPSDRDYQVFPLEEWEWRKNYRVWEANRKVFLYPENYIEPELRDDKTPLFEELESELLQQEINADTVLDAYAKYMKGFDELAHLKIAGSYHEKDASSETDALHLFGVTSDEPPAYYYRRVENIHYAETNHDRGVIWGPWQKINVQIPVRKVAPIVYNGRLHVFWVKVNTLSNTLFHDSKSIFTGYSHKFSIEFTTLKLNNTWTPPQKLSLKDCIPFKGNGVIEDPLVEQIERKKFPEVLEILTGFPFNNLTPDQLVAKKNLIIPRYDLIPHYNPIDEYTLKGFMWDQVYPSIDETGRLILTGMGYQMRAAIDFYNLYIQNIGTPISYYIYIDQNDPNLKFENPVKENVIATGISQKPGKIICFEKNTLYRGKSPDIQYFDNYAYSTLITSINRSDVLNGLIGRHWSPNTISKTFHDESSDNIIIQERLGYLKYNGSLSVINGSFADGIIDVQGDILLAQGTAITGDGFLVKRIGTTLSETLTRTLFTSGVDAMLDINTQKELAEENSPLQQDGEIGFLNINEYSWGSGYANASFYIVGGKRFLFLSKDRSPVAEIYKINDDGTINDPYHPIYVNMGDVWNTIIFYYNGSEILVLLLKSDSGSRKTLGRVHKVDPNGEIITNNNFQDFNWDQQWSIAHLYVTAVPSPTALFIISLRENTSVGSGDNVHIHKIKEDGKIDDNNLWASYKWEDGWTSMCSYFRKEPGKALKCYLFLLRESGYGADGNNVRIHLITNDGKIGEKIAGYRWTEGWTSASVYSVGTKRFLLTLRKKKFERDGSNVQIYEIKETGELGKKIASYKWDENWKIIKFYNTANGHGYLLSVNEFNVQSGGNFSCINIHPVVQNRITDLVVSGKIDFKGAYGNYYREIFFHIPFTIANFLNSQGKYADAQKWYNYIFNPLSNEVIDVSKPSLTPDEKKKLESGRNWQYLEFRENDIETLRKQLIDSGAIEAYKKDPFNPHAIARLRLSAYQKSIVMKYIDNLLDWGDHEFTKDTMESVNEATLIYVIAKDILGDRPPQIGRCGEGKTEPTTYQDILPVLNNGSEFLIELEHYTTVHTPVETIEPVELFLSDASVAPYPYRMETIEWYALPQKVATAATGSGFAYAASSGFGVSLPQREKLEDVQYGLLPEVTVRPANDLATGAFSRGALKGLDWIKNSLKTRDIKRLPSYAESILRQVSPAFCVPGNKDLLDYYNRVDDRLYKIRNCMNIQGQKRQLALFAPEIDPRLLVRAKAAGLSLDDILNSLSGNLPPYRFAYILERAKAITATVQSFGASLLSAIEKKNSEELALLRMTQQQNILEMASKSRKMEIDSANEGIKVMNDKIESLNYQLGYYDSLISEGRNPNEVVQSNSRNIASGLRQQEALLGTMVGILALIPQIGAPTAMKYGGLEMQGSAAGFALAMKSIADYNDNSSASAGLEAGFDRRLEGWKHQKKLLQYDLKQSEKNLKVAEIRRDILIESEKIHQKSIEHNDDVLEFYGDKFSNLGLYTWLSTTMQRLFKEAYNNALAIARLAEQAYRFERDDDTVFFENSYFESPRAGLLAGERLLMALQSMERRYLETNYRKNEIDQAFSLTQLNPAALLTLKQTGSCKFSIPEIFFDLFYPGQYQRKIQSVRLTIPSVTGPYTNVSATLSLTSSEIRMKPILGNSEKEIQPVPTSRTTTIATSTAQNDAGVFQLNFRDDRYMPFEGAGAINSSWKLSLPKNFRQFDYNTINDVIIHVSYTAEYDESFRNDVEGENASIEKSLQENTLSRTFSFRQEFSNDFHRLTEQALGQEVTFKIQNKHFPLFMNGRNLKVTKAMLILVTPKSQDVDDKVEIVINGSPIKGFNKDEHFGYLYTMDLGRLFNAGIINDHHTISISNSGNLAPTAPATGYAAAIDTEKMEDIVLYIEYKSTKK